MDKLLYINTVSDIRIKEMVEIIPNKDKELPNQITLTIQSIGANEITPIFSKDASGTTIFSSIDEIGTKFILDGKEVTSDDFQVVTKSQDKVNYNFFGLQFEDSNEHTLKISLVNSKIPNFQRINTGAGYSANSITSVVISNSITEINEYAFSWCTNLTSAALGNSVTTIGGNAFSHCTGLTSITIPDSVTNIGFSAFANCTGLTSVTIGNSVATIKGNAFNSCSSLISITSLATIAPTITSLTFFSVSNAGTLHVPAGSDYSTWMSTSDYYLGKYNWTKVEDA